MKKIILSLAFSVVVISPAYSTDANLSVPTIDYNNPADSITDFNLLTGAWNVSEHVQFCPLAESNNNQKDKGAIVSSSGLSGYSTELDGVTYTIFESKMAGIGWIMGAKDTAATQWTPLKSTETVVYPYPNSSSQTNNLGANVRFAFVKLPGNIPMGVNTFSKQEIAKFKCYLRNQLVQTALISVNTATINVASLACKVNSAKNVPIPLGIFMSNDLPAVSKNFGNFSTSVDLSCDSGVIPWMTISDASNSNNTTDIINLSPDSTATGIGVQVFYNNQTVAKPLGLDSTSKGNSNQFQVGNKTTGNGQLVSIPLQFKYIRTQEVVTPGDANAAATVTFSYQ
ncbi:fimbrial protein [Serratia fonticola]|uniref:fimbrial protein n=1 Tax=Serratia fonticola TaxID=47917 RepID=UPI0015766799|nr:fimbrial protein [Serratia fonticola]NTY88406.1 fimbrial protein [Serratia fonticola]NTZ14971.1 fimbrial protein [Serratia fonticola]HBE9180242.1 fimbrial protein [Serratia fonticola]